ncbi:MarR family transcriptional regulator, partial [Bifidobacteriaceae bacterium VN003]
MAINHNEFKLLTTLLNNKNRSAQLSQRDIASQSGISLGTVNSAIKSAENKNLIETTNELRITEEGMKSLEPYKVRNAIIMAAGFSSRFSPISYEIPKGLIKVRGEVLIERQIKQLNEAGINDITIVVGYKQEQFFYLEDAFNVKIVPNSEYSTRNNNSSIMAVANQLS